MLRIVCSVLLFVLCYASYAQQNRRVIEGKAQGTTYKVVYYAQSELVTKIEVDSILNIIDLSMSTYRKESLISTFNKPEISSLKLDKWMLAVMKRSFEIHQKSKGLFDVTVEPLVSLWGFGPQKPQHAPSATEIKAALQHVGMDKLRLKGDILYKKVANVRIDLNGIAQGYSVDLLADFISHKKVDSFLVELGGELKTKGRKPDRQPFTVAVERPPGADNTNFILALQDCAVTTAGNYRNARVINGTKIHHHINPVDGYPIKNNIASVTVIAKNAIDADGYDNVFMAMPVAEGLRLANKIKDVEIYIIFFEDGFYKEAFSSGFYKYIQPN